MHALSFANTIKTAPEIRPLFNVGCLMDIQCGRYILGKYGESIMNGGLARFTGIGGRANTYKSTLAHFFLLRVIERYIRSAGIVYDSELSMTRDRLIDLFCYMSNQPLEVGRALFTDSRMSLTDASVMLGDSFFDMLKEYGRKKVELPKKESHGTTPFVDSNGDNFIAMFPTPAEIDSMSRFNVRVVDEMMDKNTAGDSSTNMEAMTGNRVKNQIIIQMPTLAEEACMPLIVTAHVDDKIQMDPYAPPQAKLAFLNNKLSFKYVPNQFLFLPNNLWYCFSAHALNNKTTKLAEFPYSPEHAGAVSDLMEITVQNLRGKYGGSGNPYQILVSQQEGVLIGLTEFNYCKENGRFGISGNVQNYFMTLAPEFKLMRTNVRQKIRENPKLARVMEITSELCQMQQLYTNIPAAARCTAEELYNDLIAMGYDWDVLLNTRGYWIFEEDVTADTKPFLSTMDLVRMRMGLYVPYWLSDEDKAKIKANTVVPIAAGAIVLGSTPTAKTKDKVKAA